MRMCACASASITPQSRAQSRKACTFRSLCLRERTPKECLCALEPPPRVLSRLVAAQAAYDEQRRRVEGQEKARELAVAREQEAAYLERVRAAGEHTPPQHFGRPKVQWFY